MSGGQLVERPYDIEKLSEILGDKIKSHCETTGERFDSLVFISLGSLAVGERLAERFEFDEVDILNMGMTKDKTNSDLTFRFGQMPSRLEVEGRDLLVVDEVWRSGTTMSYAKRFLLGLGAGTVRCGVLHYVVPEGQVPDEHAPDWFGTLIDTPDIVYPRQRLTVLRTPSTVRQLNREPWNRRS